MFLQIFLINYKKKIFLSRKLCLLVLHLLKKRQNIIRITLYSFSGPFQALQADLASISFLARSVVDPKFCLLFVDLFPSKIYTYPMKTRNLLPKRIELFYNDINKKRDSKMRLQSDQEFKQRKIFELNTKFNVQYKFKGWKSFCSRTKN